jgi:DNA polymerase (family 10)
MADVLEEIAVLLEMKDENPFKVRAYRHGAEIIRGFDDSIVALAARNELEDIKGIGEALRDKLHELAVTGSLKFHEELKATFPPGLFALFELQGLGPKKVKRLHQELGIGSIADLKTACTSGKIAELSGFGAKSQERILEAIMLHESSAGLRLLGEVSTLANDIVEALRAHSAVNRAAIAGSFRRAKETVHDLDFLVATKSPAEVCSDFTKLPQVHAVIACGATKASVRTEDGIQCDLRAVSNQEFPFALQYFTGSKEHNVALRSLALKHGLSLNEYGFTRTAKHDGSDELPNVQDESDIYQALGLHFIEPELREHRGEIEEAAKHPLPRLIELSHLRGTFHNHTTASDGVNTLEQMAEEAAALGLQYLGIADHSKTMAVANGLDEERLLAQVEEIRKLNRGFDGFQLLAGSEVDILRDGTLDFADDTLAHLDYCVASVHTAFSLDEAAMTRRICRAMEHEQVTIIGHLTGRLLLKRDGYAVNHATIIDCAAETRTAIELNCNPQRLDMDWRWWKRARDKGVLCAINPDAHSTGGIHHLGIGVRIARKGWLKKEDVLNTRPLEAIETFLKTPKSKR